MNRSSPAMNVAKQTTMLTFVRCDIRASRFRLLLRRRGTNCDLDTSATDLGREQFSPSSEPADVARVRRVRLRYR